MRCVMGFGGGGMKTEAAARLALQLIAITEAAGT